MSQDCSYNQFLSRDGTSQPQRQLAALLPDYVLVDERSMEDLIAFAEQYAAEIAYFNLQDTVADGDWVAFFEGKEIRSDLRTEPHFALFLAFLDMFKVAQDDMNTITERHLEFYYEDVLRLVSRPEVSDQVNMIFDLAAGVTSTLITKGTQLNAGTDETGADVIFEVNEDTVITNAEVTELKADFVDLPSTGGDYRIYGSPIANSADGNGEEIETEEKSWKTFGATGRPGSNIGFALSSPILRLNEGSRTIRLKLNFDAALGQSISGTAQPFRVYLSGAEEWIEIITSGDDQNGNIQVGASLNTNQTINTAATSIANTLYIDVELNDEVDPIVDYNQELLIQEFNTQWPVIRVELDTTNFASYGYQALKGAVLNSVDMEVNVVGIRDLIMQNDQSSIDPTSPFLPFGPRPVLGSRFYIGSWEVLQKKVDSLSININWAGLPLDLDRGFDTYYSQYVDNDRENDTFTAKVSILDEKLWKDASFSGNDDTRLFDSVTTAPVSFAFSSKKFNIHRNLAGKDILEKERTIVVNDTVLLGNIRRDVDLETFARFETTSKKGFIRLELNGTDFGHIDYGPSLTEKVLDLTTNPNTILPREPYTPEIQELSIDYSSSVSFELNSATTNLDPNETIEDHFNERVEQFYHTESFGVRENHQYNLTFGETGSTVYMLPQYNNEGSLYIGLNNFNAPQTLHLLFQVSEGSASPDVLPPTVRWSYLVNNQWVAFKPNEIIKDTTTGLLTTGIISFDVSKKATGNNSLFTNDLHWIRAQVANTSRGIGDLIDVRAQALEATYVNNGNSATRLANPLPAESVGDLVAFDINVDSIEQPFASFGGKIAETNNAFFTRISERLRHKNRAINLWDYEHIVLEEHPDIYKVKTVNHCRYDGTLDAQVYSESIAGHVTVLAVSKTLNRNGIEPLQPKTSLLELTQIKNTLSKVTPPCVELHVQNPIFEEILLEFSVMFNDGLDKGFFEKQLNADLIAFLAPWTVNGDADLSFGGKLHNSVIINFIEELSYVNFVFCFKMYQVVINDPNDPSQNTVTVVDEAEATTAVSILTSAKEHFINVVESEEECEECPDNLIAINGVKVTNPEDCGCDSPADDNDDCGDIKGIGVMIVEDLGKDKFQVD